MHWNFYFELFYSGGMRIGIAFILWLTIWSLLLYGYPKPIVNTLDNGLTLVTVADPNATVTSSYVFIRTGSLFEGKWMGAGLSHYLEHLVSGGTTKKQTEDQYRQIIDGLGGISNAYTTYDHTAYFIKSSSENTPKAIQVLYEWMAFADWTEEEYHREKGVILKEMERAKSNVPREIFQHTQSLFYKDSPYRFPILGYKDVFLKSSSDDLKAYYKLNYVPDNMVVVIGGNVSKNMVLKQVSETFGTLPKSAAPIRYQSNEMRLISSANSTIQMTSLKQSRIVIRYPIVSFYHKDVYPLDLLAYIFGQGQQSLMYQEFVVKKKLATSIHVQSITPTYDTGYFEIMLESHRDHHTVINEVQSFLDQFRWRRLKKNVVRKAILQKRNAYILGNQSLDHYLKDIGQAMMMGQNPLFFDVYSNRFSDVRIEDLNRVTQTYLSEHSRQTYRFTNTVNASVDSTQSETTKPVLEIVKPGIQMIKIKESNQDIVSITFKFDGGIRSETPSTNGIGQLSADLIGKKIKGMTRKDLQNAFEERGASVKARLNHNALTYQILTTAKDVPALVPLFIKGITAFDVDQATFSEAKQQLLKRIQKKNEEWFQEALDHVKLGMNHSETMFYYPISGTVETVTGLSMASVQDYVRRRSAMSPITITIQSHDPHYIADMIKKELQNIEPRDAIPPQPFELEPAKTHALQLNQPVGVVMRVDPINRSEKTLMNYVSMQLVDALLSGMRYPSGVLHQRLRGNQLVYVVHTLHMRWEDQDMLLTYALTDPENVMKVSHMINTAFDEIKTSITNDQLQLAKAQVLFNFQHTRQDMASKRHDIGFQYQRFGKIYHDKDIQKVLEKIQIDDVIRYANEYLGTPHQFNFNG